MNTLISILSIIGTILQWGFCLIGFIVVVCVIMSFFLIPDHEGQHEDFKEYDTADYSLQDEDDLIYGGRL